MPEIASAWVTLTVSARGARRDVESELNRINGAAAGRRAGQQLSSGVVGAMNLSGVERQLMAVGQRAGAAAGKAIGTGLKAGAAAGVAALGTSIKLGVDRLMAIDDARGKLRGLGHDTAAQAKIMDSALAAVRGTAFGLGDAATISASAVAAGIKPGKDLTAYLKMTADASTIAGSSLSEMGSIINGVQTSGKAMTGDLSQLADRGLPIFQWIGKELGKTGDEVGDMASKSKISSEIFFKAITNNIGGAALESGKTVRGSFNNMKAAMGRFGAALSEPGFTRAPGTFTRITAAIDGFTPAAQRAARAFDKRMFDEWVPAAQNAWRELQSNPNVRSNLAEVGAVFHSLAAAAQTAWPALVQIGSSLGQASAALGVSTWKLFLTTLEAAAGAVNLLVGPLQSVAGFMSSHQGIVTAAVGAWLLFRTVPAVLANLRAGVASVGSSTATATGAVQRMGAGLGQAQAGFRNLGSTMGSVRGSISNFTSSYRDLVRWTGQANSSISPLGRALFGTGQQAQTASAHLRAMGNVAGSVASSGMGALRKGASGVVDALGGPWGAAFAAAGIAAMLIVSKNQKSAQSFDALQRAIKNTANARVELSEALVNNAGSETSADVKAASKDRIAALRAELDAAGNRSGSFLDHMRAEGKSLFSTESIFGGNDRTQAEAIEQEGAKAKEAQAALDGLKLTQQSLSDVTTGSAAAFDAMVSKLESAGQGGKDAAAKLKEARTEFVNAQLVALKLTPGIGQLSKAMQVLGDKTASAADKSSALKTALDALNPARTASDADSSHTKTLKQITEAAVEAADATGGLGDALFKAGGAINATLPNGAALNDTLKTMVDSTADVAAKGGDMPAALAANDRAIADLAKQYGTTVEKVRAAANTLGLQDAIWAQAAAKGNDVSRSIGAVATAFSKVDGKSMSVSVKTTDIEAARGQLTQLGFAVESMPDGTTTITANTADAKARLAEIQTIIAANIPPNKPVSVTAPGGQATFDLLKSLGVAVTTLPSGEIKMTSPMSAQVKQLLEQLGVAVRTLPDGTVRVSAPGLSETLTAMNGLKATVTSIPGTTRVKVVYDTSGMAPNPNGVGIPLVPGGTSSVGAVPNANGSIRSYADGGFDGQLPSQAIHQKGRGRGLVQWAEGSTGVESFIPWAGGKRKRSTMILSETARAFGYQLVRPGAFFQKFEDGGISVDKLKTYAAGIEGGTYGFGGGAGSALTDTDCSGAQASIANFITGGSGRFATGNEGEALTARGFVMGDPPPGVAAYAVGWLNGGPGGGHTAGTIIDPTGGNVNVEMGGARGNGQYGGTAAGAAGFPNRAYILLQGQDTSDSGTGGGVDTAGTGGGSGGSGGGFGSLGSSIGAALFGNRGGGSGGGTGGSGKPAATAKQLREAQDKATDTEKAAALARTKLAEAENNPKATASAKQAAKDRVEKTERDAKQAKADLEALKTQGTKTGDDKTGDGKTGDSSASEFQSLGQSLMSGVFQTIGLDGSVFSNPFEWPNVKSLFAGINYAGSLAKVMGGNKGTGEDVGGLVGGAGAGLGLNLPNVTDFMKPLTQTPQTPINGQTVMPGGPLPITYDNSVNIQNAGMNPKDVVDKVNARQNAAFRRQSGALAR